MLIPGLLLAGAFVKVALFNLPPAEELANDWYGWRGADAARAAAGSLGTLLLVAAPLLLLAPRRRVAALWLLNALVTLVVIVDLLHFRFFGDVTSIAAVSAWSQLVLVRDSISQMVRPGDVILFSDLMLVPWIARATMPKAAASPRFPRGGRRVAAVALFAGLTLTAVPVVVTVRDPEGVLGWFRYYGVRRIGLLNYHAYEAGWQAAHDAIGGRRISPEDRRRARDVVSRWRPVAYAPSDLFGVAEGRNVVLIMVESLHAFPLGLRLDGKEVTPNLNALASRSLTFENFYSQAWDGHSSDGEFTSLHSLHPLRAGSVSMTYPRHFYRALPLVLRELGYATLSAHAYFGELWRMREMHPRLGFQQSLFREDYRGTDKIGMGLSDAEFLRQTLRRLEDLPRPFLAFLMTLSTHHPYEIPEREVRLRLPHDLQDTVLGRYLQAVHYTDGAIGEFVRELEAGGLLDQTVLVIYGDHAAHLGLGDDYFLGRVLEQHADWGPSTRGEFDATLWRARHTVPLLIHLPGDAAAARRFGSAGHLDIAPTLLNLLGIEGHEMVGLGRDLTRGENSVVVFRDGSFVEGSAYCRPATTNGERPGCWDARTGQAVDPTPYRSRFDQAREHLEVSDLLVTGDLIPRR